MEVDERLKAYLRKYVGEQDSLVAKFMIKTGAKIEEVCLVERETENGRVFYPDWKKKYEPIAE